MKPGLINPRTVAIHFALFLSLVGLVWAEPSGTLVMVVTNPADGAGGGMAVIGAADGALVSGSALGWANVAYSTDRDFPAKLRQAGAWLVVNHKLAVGCLEAEE